MPASCVTSTTGRLWVQVADAIDDTRVYDGIHFRFEQEAGSRQGRDVGHYILDNYLRPPQDAGDLGDNE